MRSLASIALIATLILAVSWFAFQDAGPPRAPDPPSAVAQPAGPSAEPVLAESDAPQPQRAPATVTEVDPEGTSGAAADERPARPAETTFTLVGSLVRPDRHSVRVTHVVATLTDEAGLPRTFEGRDTDTIVFEKVPHGTFELRVDAATPVRVDNREVIWAGFVSADELGAHPLVPHVRAYLESSGSPESSRSLESSRSQSAT